MKHNKYFYLILLSLALLSPAIPENDDELKIKIIYPLSNEVLSLNGKNIFILGQINLQNAKLKVNNTDANIDDDGAFISYSPVILFEENGVTKGKFIFEATVGSQTFSAEKIYNVKHTFRELSSDTLEIDLDYPTSPGQDISLKVGDILEVELRASPGSQMTFSVEGISGSFPMAETTVKKDYILGDAIFGDGFKGIEREINGVYRGSIRIDKNLKDAPITFTAKKPGFPDKQKVAGGKITTLDSSIPLVGKTVYEPNKIIARYGPDAGYFLFLDEDINLEIVKKIGDSYEVKLGKNHSLFINRNSVTLLPEGTPSPRADIEVIRVSETDRNALVEFGFSERIPYKVIQHNSPQRLELLFYNVTSSIDYINHFRSSDFVSEVTWHQIEDGTISVNIFLNQRTHWGYTPTYSNSTLLLKINKPARKNSEFLFWGNQLDGRRIVLDPGHTPDLGAVGPRGIKEKDVNFAIAKKLKSLLEDAGATVNLTHNGEGISLRERKQRVNSFSPEISVSLHNNALPQGVNPLTHNGTSAYYYYPQAKPLAELIYKNLLTDIEVQDFGFYWDNLYMCRIPECIAVLVEPVFMSIPTQEKLIATDEFQNKIAESIFRSLEKFYEEYSE
ncbi:MAG: N-acetylmuramoyl-L-alanine amidase [Ignavibacteriaceae bacterium]